MSHSEAVKTILVPDAQQQIHIFAPYQTGLMNQHQAIVASFDLDKHGFIY